VPNIKAKSNHFPFYPVIEKFELKAAFMRLAVKFTCYVIISIVALILTLLIAAIVDAKAWILSEKKGAGDEEEDFLY
jgi:hypothetical protein